MHDALAIRLRNVSKIYRLHGSQSDQLIDVLGLQRFGLKTKTQPKEFAALSDISLDVPRGHRIGIVGRNGAGKTTLLKLICGNFAPTSGKLDVYGSVQALMNVGLGFHPEYTGRENVESSLQYNGLSRSEYQRAFDGIVEFCELGDFLDQPFKTYSLGMQARLMFASATAINPDILIVDEVLGAGDAYFVAKSKARVESMISAGCTMLLVSHSMQQVLQLCDEVIWMEQGRIKMKGDSLLVVKAYEESLHGRMQALVGNAAPEQPASVAKSIQTTHSQEGAMPTWIVSSLDRGAIAPELELQEPVFRPHQFSWSFPELTESDRRQFRHVARGGLSRWDSELGVKLVGFSIMTEQGIDNRLRVLHPAKFVLNLEAEVSGHYSCMYGIVLNDSLGNVVARIWSPADEFDLLERQTKQVEMLFNPVQLGPGEYTIGISVVESAPIEKLNTSRRFDLLGRSFFCIVEMDESLAAASANFIHTAEWS